MLITCLRHATAEPTILQSKDAERALVKKGREQVLRVSQFCRKNALIPAVLYCSPILRAQQTARLLQNHLPDCPSFQTAEWLDLTASTEAIVTALTKLEMAGVNDIWLVGHEPNTSMLIAQLLEGPAECVLIKKASLTRIFVDFNRSPAAQLLWSIPCALMR